MWLTNTHIIEKSNSDSFFHQNQWESREREMSGINKIPHLRVVLTVLIFQIPELLMGRYLIQTLASEGQKHQHDKVVVFLSITMTRNLANTAKNLLEDNRC